MSASLGGHVPRYGDQDSLSTTMTVTLRDIGRYGLGKDPSEDVRRILHDDLW